MWQKIKRWLVKTPPKPKTVLARANMGGKGYYYLRKECEIVEIN